MPRLMRVQSYCATEDRRWFQVLLFWRDGVVSRSVPFSSMSETDCENAGPEIVGSADRLCE